MKKIFKFLISVSLLTVLILPTGLKAQNDSDLTILFTHDLHDNLEAYNMEIDNEIQSRGGFGRLATAIKAEREIDEELLLVDAGDFAMGTLFQTIFTSHAPALSLMGEMGYDATTLGNHEFDFRATGLAESLVSATKENENLPEILASNTVFPEAMDENLDKLKEAFITYGVKDYTVLNKNGFKVGLFGLMGIDADSNAPMSQVEFNDMIKESERVVKTLKEEEEVDLIIALSHSGTEGEPGKGEDELLAKSVSDIDVIISGHSHTTLAEPIIVGDTIIASSGRYGENLGVLKINQEVERWSLSDYQIKAIDDSYAFDQNIVDKIEVFKENINDEYLSRYNLEYDQVVARAPFNFTPALELAKVQEDEPLGGLIGDAYIYATKTAEKEDYRPVDVAVVPSGVIRDSIVKGDLTVKDVFNISPLGIGKDKISGYPLLDVYLTGKELKTAAEVDASIQPLMSAAQLYMPGLFYRFNPNRIIFNKVTDIHLKREDGLEEIDDKKLYRVVANLYSAQMLNIVGDKSMGLLKLEPKDEDGNLVEDFEERIIYNGDEEVKEWVALTNYLQSMPKVDGTPEIKEKYAGEQLNKSVEPDNNIISIISKPNVYSIAIYSIGLLLLVLVITLVRFIIKKIRQRKYKQYK